MSVLDPYVPPPINPNPPEEEQEQEQEAEEDEETAPTEEEVPNEMKETPIDNENENEIVTNNDQGVQSKRRGSGNANMQQVSKVQILFILRFSFHCFSSISIVKDKI